MCFFVCVWFIWSATTNNTRPKRIICIANYALYAIVYSTSMKLSFHTPLLLSVSFWPPLFLIAFLFRLLFLYLLLFILSGHRLLVWLHQFAFHFQLVVPCSLHAWHRPENKRNRKRSLKRQTMREIERNKMSEIWLAVIFPSRHVIDNTHRWKLRLRRIAQANFLFYFQHNRPKCERRKETNIIARHTANDDNNKMRNENRFARRLINYLRYWWKKKDFVGVVVVRNMSLAAKLRKTGIYVFKMQQDWGVLALAQLCIIVLFLRAIPK